MGPLLALALAASVDCRTDRDCFAAAAQTCRPAKYTSSEETQIDTAPPIAMTAKSAYRVVPGNAGFCRLDIDTTISAVRSAAFSPSAAAEVAEAANTSPLASMVCVGTPEQLTQHVLTGAELACYPLGCPPPTARVAPGCAWTSCEQGVPRLVCSSKGSTRTCGFVHDAPCTYRGRKASCGVALLLSGTMTCTASCAADGQAPAIACR